MNNINTTTFISPFQNSIEIDSSNHNNEDEENELDETNDGIYNKEDQIDNSKEHILHKDNDDNNILEPVNIDNFIN